nr:hypothetical protein [Tanacetum cinerariifolium]
MACSYFSLQPDFQIEECPSPKRWLFLTTVSHQSVGFISLVHSICALSALRCSGLRTASTAAKPCQGDSSEFYLITESRVSGWVITHLWVCGTKPATNCALAHAPNKVHATGGNKENLSSSLDVCEHAVNRVYAFHSSSRITAFMGHGVKFLGLIYVDVSCEGCLEDATE